MVTDIFTRRASQWLEAVKGVRVEYDQHFGRLALRIEFGHLCPPPAWLAQLTLTLVADATGERIRCRISEATCTERTAYASISATDETDLIARLGVGITVPIEAVVLDYDGIQQFYLNGTSRARFLARPCATGSREDCLIAL